MKSFRFIGLMAEGELWWSPDLAVSACRVRNGKWYCWRGNWEQQHAGESSEVCGSLEDAFESLQQLTRV